MAGIKLNYLWVSLLKLRDRKKPLPFIDLSFLCTVPFSRRYRGENLRGGMVLLPLFMLKLLWLVPPSSSNMLDLSVLEGDAPPCYNSTFIQYPFAVTGNGSVGLTPLPGFEIECDAKQGGGPMLKLGGDPYPLLNISLPEGYVRIVGRAFVSRCNSVEYNHVLNLTGTPYTFSSTLNKFTATGCDAMALIHGSGSSGGDDKRPSSGCVSFCVDRATVIGGVCSGVGCCQATVPPGLKNFPLEFQSVRGLTGSRNEPKELPCSKAFIVDKAWYKFSPDDLKGYHDDEFRPVFLDWAIGNQTCKEVTRRNPTDYACKGKSHCIDSPDRVGYRCMCDHGYDGNPYIPGGCKDINECEGPDHPCERECINTVGSYKCKCPRGMVGDGLKKGSGCKRIAPPLEIALGMGLVSLVILLMVSLWVYWGLKQRRIRKRKQKYFLQNGGLLLHQRIASRQETARIFSSEELERATDNFDKNQVVGQGGYGIVYKGVLADGRVVAIKKSKLVDETQIEQFINEVVILSQINHKNVVKLLGCCLETQVPLLVYEFISNGTLSHHIHDKSTTSPMPWEDRLRIAVETAGALAYLHSAVSIPIIHRDIKSANILLDEKYTAKVSDFGASRLVPYDQTHITTLVQGTLGYLDPEYFQTSQLTEKSDVYSFGVVLVELLTKEKVISFCRTEEGRNIASHFVMVEENRLLEVVDGQVAEEAGERHLFVVAQLAKRCLRLKGEERPTMKEVAVELDALRRLMKLHLVPKSHDEFSPDNYWNPNNSGTTGQGSMEDHLLLSMDLVV